MVLQTSVPPKRLTLAQETEQLLVKLLVQGRLKPGEKLNEEMLCRKLGLTRTPLREALRALAARGLLEHQANRGYRVRPLERADIVQLYQLREVLEGLAARLLAGHIMQEQINRLRKLIERIPTDHITTAGLKADWTFHSQIAEWSGNTFLIEALSAPHVLVRAMVASQQSKPLPPGPHSRHELVVDALAARDPERAEDAMRAHIRNAMERILSQPSFTASEAADSRHNSKGGSTK